MPFVPRSAVEILRSLTARLVARGPLSDVAEGSADHHHLLGIAELLAGAEIRMRRIRDSFLFTDPDIEDVELDERLAELPSSGLRRLPPVAATGNVLALARAATDAADELIVKAGSVLVRRSDDPAMVYRTVQDATFGIGVVLVDSVRIVCQTPGADGNCAAGTVDQIVSAPERIVSAVNKGPLTTGQDRESRAAAQKRGAAYMAGLARCQPKALEMLALSFTASDKTRVKFARVFEDVTRPGYSELIVDDGTGLPGLTKAGAVASGTVPINGQTQLWHEAPAEAPITKIKTVLGGVTTNLFAPQDFTSIHERGLVILPVGKLAAGTVWTIEGYTVRTSIIAELQDAAEGDASVAANKSGWRAAGTRVVVRPPDILGGGTAYDILVVAANYADIAAVQSQAQDDTVAYHATLGPGEPMYVARLIDALLDNANLLNVQVFEPGTSTPKGDVYPQPHQVVRTTKALIKIITSPGS